MKRSIRNIFGPLGLAAAMLWLSATPALAAPQLGVSLERDEAEFPTVFHSDERVDFTVKVKNVAQKTESVIPGTVLTCDPNKSRWKGNPTSFAFKWLSSGVQVGTGATYEVQVADEGHELQCLVSGENASGASVSFTLPLLVGPPPSPGPPVYSGSGLPRPLITESTASAGSEITCTAPSSWTGSPSWTFEWLRDGGPPNGEVTGTTATTSTYKVDAADVPGVLQCVAIAKTGSGQAPTGGTVVTISPVRATSPAPSPFPPSSEAFLQPYAAFLPSIVDPNSTNAPVTFELELPGGKETFAFTTEQEPASIEWTCEKIPASGAQHAKALCSREDALAPGVEFPALKVVTALGADAPDIATAKATAFGGGSPAPASDELEFPIEPAIPFGLSEFTAALVDELGDDYTQAGGHPFAGVSDIVVNRKRALVPDEPAETPYLPIAQTRQIIVDVPRGIVGNQLALPELCPGVEEVREGTCPPGSAVGGIQFLVSVSKGAQAIYAIEPEFGAPAQFAFLGPGEDVITFTPHLRADDGYAVSLEVASTPEVDFLESKVKLCDFGLVEVGSAGTVCRGEGDPDANSKALFTNPTRCGVPLTTRVRLRSWADPTFIEGPPFANAQVTGCDKVPFEPQADLQPTNRQADSPTGMDVEVSMPTEGLEDPDGISQSNLREAKVTFPEGMAINPSAGQGLGACSKAQITLGTNNPITCPDSSKIGSVEIETPVIEETLKGDVYIARQGDIEGSLIGFYLVFDSPKNGILVKLPAKVSPDPVTGQLTVTVADSPEQPFSAVRMHFPGGPRATLLTPPKCGKYAIKSELVPWSGGEPVVINSPFEVNQGPNGGPCPNGGLDVTLNAGSENPLAGQTSPFNVRLTRPDGSDRFTALGLHLPPGLTAYLKGVPYCPEASIAQAKNRSGTGQGQTEIDNPSCPTASKIGAVTAGAGAGESPLYVDTGKAYLAGPYKGAPLSIVAIAPAVAGPLDLGTVVVRNALKINPKTAEVDVVSDPIPTILHGVLLDIRDVRVQVDRPHFTLNPTDCEAKQVGATVSGLSGASADLANRFQVGGCDALGFKPNLKTRLFGGTHRGDFPRFKATYKPKAGDSNLEDLVLRFPRSEFIEQGHFRTICTRVQYAAGAGLGSQCPKGSIYGHIEATTPLLSEPLSGPVYLRSSDHNLPDVVFALHGQVDAEAAVRIDSVKGGLRASLEDAPDVPLTEVVLNMAGKDKGLFVNSRDVCAQANKATLKASAHNGREFEAKPVLKNPKCNQARKHKRRHRHAKR